MGNYWIICDLLPYHMWYNIRIRNSDLLDTKNFDLLAIIFYILKFIFIAMAILLWIRFSLFCCRNLYFCKSYKTIKKIRIISYYSTTDYSLILFHFMTNQLLMIMSIIILLTQATVYYNLRLYWKLGFKYVNLTSHSQVEIRCFFSPLISVGYFLNIFKNYFGCLGNPRFKCKKRNFSIFLLPTINALITHKWVKWKFFLVILQWIV